MAVNNDLESIGRELSSLADALQDEITEAWARSVDERIIDAHNAGAWADDQQVAYRIAQHHIDAAEDRLPGLYDALLTFWLPTRMHSYSAPCNHPASDEVPHVRRGVKEIARQVIVAGQRSKGGADNRERLKPNFSDVMAMAEAGRHLEALGTWLDWMTWFYEPPGLLSEDSMTKWNFHEKRFPGELDALAESAVVVAGELLSTGASCDSTPLIELTRPARGPRTTFRAAWVELEKFRAWQAANHRHDGNGTLGKAMAVKGGDSCEAEQGRVEVRLDPATEARDKWIYDECHKGTTYGDIITKLGKKPKTWARIEHPNGIKGAAQRYANRHNQPLPPARQAGRPSKNPP